MFIFCLFTASPDLSANLGAHLIGDRDILTAKLHDIAPMPNALADLQRNAERWFFQRLWSDLLPIKGRIDLAIDGLRSAQESHRTTILKLQRDLENIDKVKEGAGSWWWGRNVYWFQDEKPLAHQNRNDIVRNIQFQENQIIGLEREIFGFGKAKNSLFIAQFTLNSDKETFDIIHQRGPREELGELDYNSLKEFHDPLSRVTESVETSMLCKGTEIPSTGICRTPEDARTRIDAYISQGVLGDQTDQQNWKNQKSALDYATSWGFGKTFNKWSGTLLETMGKGFNTIVNKLSFTKRSQDTTRLALIAAGLGVTVGVMAAVMASRRRSTLFKVCFVPCYVAGVVGALAVAAQFSPASGSV